MVPKLRSPHAVSRDALRDGGDTRAPERDEQREARDEIMAGDGL